MIDCPLVLDLDQILRERPKLDPSLDSLFIRLQVRYHGLIVETHSPEEFVTTARLLLQAAATLRAITAPAYPPRKRRKGTRKK